MAKTTTDEANDHPPPGIACPKCGCRDLRVVYTRDGFGDDRATIRRRRECRHCGHLMFSVEKLAEGEK